MRSRISRTGCEGSSWCRGNASPDDEPARNPVHNKAETHMNIAVRIDDRFVKVDGRNIRYLEEGAGVPAILLHGSSLGSSADVFRRNLSALGRHGIRAIAVDLPGFGKSDTADGMSGAQRKDFVLRFIDALGLEHAALIGHSAAGNPVVSTALAHPERVSHVIILGTGSLLPPLET